MDFLLDYFVIARMKARWSFSHFFVSAFRSPSPPPHDSSRKRWNEVVVRATIIKEKIFLFRFPLSFQLCHAKKETGEKRKTSANV